MTLYVDASALLTRYLDEPDADLADDLLASDTRLVTARLTTIEVRRNLAVHLEGRPLVDTRRAFEADMEAIAVVEMDRETCGLATMIAEQTRIRTLDALHLGAARRVGGQSITVLTFDRRQAQAARTLGMSVVGT